MSREKDVAFIRNCAIIIAGLGLFAIVMVFLSRNFAAQLYTTRVDDSLMERIAPVGKINLEPIVDATPPEPAAATQPAPAVTAAEPVGDPGKAVYDQACFACHATPVLGAPVLGAVADWAPRLEKGLDMLLSNVVNGYTGDNGIMPPKGGFMHLSDEQVRTALVFMLRASGGESLVGEAPAEPQTAAEPASEPQTRANDGPAGGSNAADLVKGKEVYDSACFICHTPGAAGAPKHGDPVSWNGRLAQGMDVLNDHAIKGYMGKAGLMPPKGGRVDLSDEDVRAAVAYMLGALN